MTALVSRPTELTSKLKLRKEVFDYDLKPFSSQYLVEHLDLAIIPDMERLATFFHENLHGFPPIWAAKERSWNTVRKEIKEALAKTSEGLQLNIVLLRNLVCRLEDSQDAPDISEDPDRYVDQDPREEPISIPVRLGEITRDRYECLRGCFMEMPDLNSQMIERVQSDLLAKRISGSQIASCSERVLQRLIEIKDLCDLALGITKDPVESRPSKLVDQGKVFIPTKEQPRSYERVLSTPSTLGRELHHKSSTSTSPESSSIKFGERDTLTNNHAVSHRASQKVEKNIRREKPVKVTAEKKEKPIKATPAAPAIVKKLPRAVPFEPPAPSPAPALNYLAPKEPMPNVISANGASEISRKVELQAESERKLSDAEWQDLMEAKTELSEVRRSFMSGVRGKVALSDENIERLEKIRIELLKVGRPTMERTNQLTVVLMETEILSQELKEIALPKAQIEQVEKAISRLSFL